MQEKLKVEMESCGIDVEGTLNRVMGNENLFFCIMKKFLEDESYKKLMLKLEEKDYDAAFQVAHALKGVAGNLGLNPIVEADIVIVEKLRNHTTDGIQEDAKRLTEVYQEICTVIEKLEM